LIFAAQGAADVDVYKWISNLRGGTPGDFDEVHKRVVANARRSIVQTVLFDAMTAAFLLSDIPPNSKDGRALLLRNHELIINFDGAKSQIKGTVLELVPTMQRLINSSLSSENQKALVEKVVALSLKDRTSLAFVKTTLFAVTNRVLIVNNGNCGGLLQALEIARPAEPSIRKKRGKLAVEDGAHPSVKPVCINRRIAREHGCVFSCVRRLRPRKS
jgi:hypothetical protein